jgi:outer membrane lipoprotein carrier protein
MVELCCSIGDRLGFVVRVIGLLLLLAAVACGGTQSAGGPLAPSVGAVVVGRNPADEVVRRVQGVYRGMDRLTVKFRQRVVNKTFGLPSVNDGKFYFKRPHKMRWDYFSKRNKTHVTRSQISNGRTIWAVSKSGRWYYRQNLSRSTLRVAVAFLTGTEQLSRDFDARLLTGSQHGTTTDKVVELTPKRASAQFRNLVLVVDASSFRVKKSIVTSLTGDTNEFSFLEPDSSPEVADTWFVFNPEAARGFRQIKLAGHGAAGIARERQARQPPPPQ